MDALTVASLCALSFALGGLVRGWAIARKAHRDTQVFTFEPHFECSGEALIATVKDAKARGILR